VLKRVGQLAICGCENVLGFEDQEMSCKKRNFVKPKCDIRWTNCYLLQQLKRWN